MVTLRPCTTYGYGFVESPYLPDGKSEYWLRDSQTKQKAWRHLRKEEIATLERLGNSSRNWSDVLVSDPFDPTLVRNSCFQGLVRIGALQDEILQYHDFSIPEGIYSSRIIACDIGDHCSITDCTYLSHYIFGDRVILHSIEEMQSTNHAKFGVGIVKEGEEPSVRITINVMNEAEGRAILPFASITTADAWLWAKYRDDTLLMDSLSQMTDREMDSHRGYYGMVGNDTVIKETRIIKDVEIGENAYIKGANKLKNLTIHSSSDDSTQLGEGLELVNGIIGYGCHIFYGCKAVRFVLEDHCNLKYGARLLNSVLGDNSTVSCCEVLSNLIFPGHEQHHNNSFLIASCIMGQSNMAAGANIGSNHNSRGADGELVAGRGFWPALSSTLKHDCKFASYTLITKGNYPHELSIPLPFCLLSNGTTHDERIIMPAYWWRYNLYALERNSWKYQARDKRKHPRQTYETDYLAPDTAGEIIKGMELLETWTAQANEKKTGIKTTKAAARKMLLEGSAQDLDILVDTLECSDTPVRVIKASEGYRAYKDMLTYFGAKTVFSYVADTNTTLQDFDANTPKSMESWVNMGGQLVPESELQRLKEMIKEGKITKWEQVHAVYKAWTETYAKEQAMYAMQTLRLITEKEHLDEADWEHLKEFIVDIRSYIEVQVFLTKQKDYQNPFRMITYDNEKERDEVLGKVDDNPFIQQSKLTTERMIEKVQRCLYKA